MKKCLIYSFVLLLFFQVTIKTHAKENDYAEEIYEVQKGIIAMENIKPDIQTVKKLRDINGDINYLLFVTSNQSYIIASIANLNISEYSLEANSNPYLHVMKNQLMYGGPTSYMFLNNNGKYVDTVTNEQLIYSEELERANNNFLNYKNEYLKGKSMSWTGISETRFKRYNGTRWRNSKDNPNKDLIGACGPISASIMLAYYDDYINDGVVPASIRKRNSQNPEQLIIKLKSVTDHPKASLPNHVSQGIKRFINSYSPKKNFSSLTNLYGTWTRVVDSCKKKRPICVGLIPGKSKYGAHWVTVYQVYEDSKGKGKYKCIDNWGKYNATIDASWTVGTVALNI